MATTMPYILSLLLKEFLLLHNSDFENNHPKGVRPRGKRQNMASSWTGMPLQRAASMEQLLPKVQLPSEMVTLPQHLHGCSYTDYKAAFFCIIPPPTQEVEQEHPYQSYHSLEGMKSNTPNEDKPTESPRWDSPVNLDPHWYEKLLFYFYIQLVYSYTSP